MKSIIKYLELNNIKYKIYGKKGLIIDLGYEVEWINGYNEIKKQKAVIGISELESYNIYNYRVGLTTGYNQSEGKCFKKYKDVLNYINQILSK